MGGGRGGAGGRPGRVAAAGFLALCSALVAAPAAAHRLKVFATVEGAEIAGYGFFVGGGRAARATVRAEGPGAAPLYAGVADDAGAFRFPAPARGPVTVTLDAGDGHVAAAVLGAERFASAGAARAAEPAPAPAAAGDGGLSAAEIAAIEAAVARQTRPVLEALAAAEARVRFGEVAGGLGVIAGLTGLALWWRGRRAG
jgi:nickel transport protein